MKRELLDEAIDRVARDMTVVAASATMSRQVRVRMVAADASPSMQLWLAAATTVAALILAVLIWREPTHDTDSPVATPPLASDTTAPFTPLVAPVRPTRPVPARAQAPRTETVRNAPVSVDVAALSVEAIQFETLSQVEPLRLDEIHIGGINRDSQEFR